MAINDYHFITKWRVESTCEEISDILGGEAADLSRWWPSVYLGVKILEPGDPEKMGLGKVVDLYTKGWLPYTLRWSFKVIDIRHPHGFTIQAFGDFVGRGIWTFEQDGNYVNITYDWKIRADKPLLRTFSFMLKPIFRANHLWAMKMGEKSLQLELARRHARTETERAMIPPPPPPTTSSSVPLLLGVTSATATFAGGLYLLAKLVSPKNGGEKADK
jgi:hypothetical protein